MNSGRFDAQSTHFVEEDGELSFIEEDIVFSFVAGVGGEVFANHAVPVATVFFIEFLLDVF